MIPVPEPKLKSLYQEVILDHNKKPRNFKEIPNSSLYSHGVNPLCGDNYHLYINLDTDGRVSDIGFLGNGCAISKSSASMMTTMVKGMTRAEAGELVRHFLDMMTKYPMPAEDKSKTGRLAIFEGVREFPVRVKCATLIWHALKDALNDAAKQDDRTGGVKHESRQ